ncbi:hypothetical protein SAMN04488028_101142 [Reichenbachiella agariperforans]|uniref:Uncharacterized protein n=1 Tax=Reichenbachiella agariperforans TaxID=156994 RepID=A0A1M6JCW4_REIAG|nr:hypothetical protein SAMN04488028_101142 [Reichenbachiella agariperforans]
MNLESRSNPRSLPQKYGAIHVKQHKISYTGSTVKKKADI